MRKPASESIGKKFGRLTVVGLDHIGKHGMSYMKCICDCGNIRSVNIGALNSGDSKSCGCLAAEKTANRSTVHGLRYTVEYGIWHGIKDRCFNKNNPSFKRYGGRGITVCERWVNSFENFYNDMGKKPKGFSIERKDNDGNYCPENCMWDTIKNQSRNTSKTLKLTYEGETMCLTDWAIKLGIKRNTIWYRLRVSGWSVEDALTKPLQNVS